MNHSKSRNHYKVTKFTNTIYQRNRL